MVCSVIFIMFICLCISEKSTLEPSTNLSENGSEAMSTTLYIPSPTDTMPITTVSIESTTTVPKEENDTSTPSKICEKCSDDTGCGYFNEDGLFCDCSSEGCELVEECTDGLCRDATPCGGLNEKGETCVCGGMCIDFVNGGFCKSFCQLTPTCSCCSDGTKCWEANNKGKMCDCYDSVKEGLFSSCSLASTCRKCNDGTKCGEINANQETCVCQYSTSLGEIDSCVLRSHLDVL